MRDSQSVSDVLMIRPVRFIGNPQTAASNAFQSSVAMTEREAQRLALAEFDALASALSDAGVGVHIVEDTLEPHTPDSIFPNNWVSFHADGTVVLYPMLAPNRRAERREVILHEVGSKHGFYVSRVIDLTHHEQNERFLEGTGSLVLDRVNRIAYACVSPRTDVDVLGDFGQQLDYDIVSFEANDAHGHPIYHTNVLMSVGTKFAAVCSACIRETERAAVLETLRESGHAIVDLSYTQMSEFAGNMLELATANGDPIVAMSTRALQSLSPQQRELIEAHARRIIAAPIPTIETLGGGSVRCMLAEVHLPRRQVDRVDV